MRELRNLWAILAITGITLQVLLVRELLRSALKSYPFFFAYVIGLFLVTSANASAFFNRDFSVRANRYYWAFDATLQSLIFALVISLIYRAMDRSTRRNEVRHVLVTGSLLYVLISAYLTRNVRLGYWLTELARNLGFLAVILNLVLWAVLIKFRRADRTLLMISGGLGIHMAGKAIGHSLRQISESAILLGNLIIVLSGLLCLYIWWQAFRDFNRAERRT
jgi:hypothetical protein